jgi:NADH-quinone oxidoreductase subunit J
VDTLSGFDLNNLIFLVVTGACGIYLLLPHSHGRARPALAHRVGYALSALSVLSFLMFCRTTDVELVTKGFFYIFSLAAVGCAILTITSRDPIHSALWFAAVVLATSGLFLLSGAQFLAAGTVIVYAGAIIVTFLFVIMLAQKEGRAIYDRMARAPFLATLSSFLLLFGLVFALVGLRAQPAGPGVPVNRIALDYSNRVIPASDRLKEPKQLTPRQNIVLNRALPETSRLPESAGLGADGTHVASLGATLYTEHLVTVELAGALLFAALIGALAIATPRAPIRPSMGIVVTAASYEAQGSQPL